MTKMIETLKRNPVIPVMVIEELEDAIPMAEALVKGGLDVLEITLRTEVALDAIRAIKSAIPDAIVGSGTVIDQKTLQSSLDAGCDFMVSPGMTPGLLKEIISDGLNVLPGVSTASEAMTLLEAGFDCLKFFPAESSGGVPLLKSLSGPLPQITFCPTGGVSLSNFNQYLALSNVACVGGSWMLDKQSIQSKDWDNITQSCQDVYSRLENF